MMDPHDTIPPDQDRRGSDGTPAVGRREYDHLDEYFAAKLEEMRVGAVSKDGLVIQAARKTRAIAVLSAAVVSMVSAVVGTMFWLGARNMGPGERADRTDHNVSTLRDTTIQWHNERIRDSEENKQGLYFLLRRNCSQMTDREIRDFNGVDICDAAWHPLDHALKTQAR